MQVGGGISSGGRVGWLITARLLVRSLTLIAPYELAVALHG